MGQIVIYLSMVKRLLNLKQKTLRLFHIHYVQETKDWANDNVKKTGFNGYIYDFSTDYKVINKSNILGIHKYLMKKK